MVHTPAVPTSEADLAHRSANRARSGDLERGGDVGPYGPAAVLALQRRAGNGAVVAAIARVPATRGAFALAGRTPYAVQRCGSEQHEGCPCAEAPATDTAVQRAAAPAQADEDVLGQPLATLDRAAAQLQQRVGEAPDPELVAHLEHLATARAELARLRAEAGPQEQAQAADHLRAAAVAHAPAFVAAQVAEQVGAASAGPAGTATDPAVSRTAVQRVPALAPAAVPLVAAGPPGWAVLAGIAVVAAVVAVVYVATREESTDATTDATSEPRVEERPKSCATEYPGVRTCASLPGQFVHPVRRRR